MSRIAILRGDTPDSHSEALRTFKGLQAIGKDDYELIAYRDIVFSISDDHVAVTFGERDLKDFDLVYIRDFHGYEFERNAVAMYLAHHGRKLLNSDATRFQHISKLTQYLAFALGGVSIPSSLYGKGERFLKAVIEKFSFPIVVKSIIASSGNDNFLVHDEDQLRSLFTEHDKKFIVQEAIPNDGDYRVIVLGEKVECVVHRKSKPDDHRNNISQGGEKTYLDLEAVPRSYIDLAIKAAKTLEREVCGVDIMVNTETGQPVVLEGNFNFGIRPLPGAAADSIPQELHGLADYLSEKAAE